MSNNLLLAACVAGAVLLVVKKQAVAATTTANAAAGVSGMTLAQMRAAGLIYTPQQQQTANVNGDMWARLLGDGWRNLVSAQNKDGSPAMLVNSFGQVSTTDGKPVGGSDPMAAYSLALGGLPNAPSIDYLGGLNPLTAGAMDGNQYTGATMPVLTWGDF